MWLGQGLVEDRDTDGHVDLIAVITQARTGAAADGRARQQPNHDNCAENARRLRAAGLDVVELPLLPYAEVAGEPVAGSYMNLYICNGAVIVPVADQDSDEVALAIIAAEFPGREVVPVPGLVIAFGGGGPHCITQQVPVSDAELADQRLLTAFGPLTSPARTRESQRPPLRLGLVQERWHADPDEHLAALSAGIRTAAGAGGVDRLPAGADVVAVLRDHARRP